MKFADFSKNFNILFLSLSLSAHLNVGAASDFNADYYKIHSISDSTLFILLIHKFM